jgi:site-specific recombinase XerC
LAATSLLDSRALGRPAVRWVEVDPKRRALSHQLRMLQREIDRLPSSRDRAVLKLLMLTGLRIAGLATLEREDVRLSQRTSELVIRNRKGDRRRLIPLSRPARAALREWLLIAPDVLPRPDVASGRCGSPVPARRSRYARSETGLRGDAQRWSGGIGTCAAARAGDAA